MRSRSRDLVITLALGLGLTLALLWRLGASPTPATAAPAGSLVTVCPAGPPDCEYAVIQDAVDAASDGDLIKVATGAYTGVGGRPALPGYPHPPASGILTQVVFISKTVTIRGGYTTAFAEPPDPQANPTTMDGQGQGRVLVIADMVSPTIEGVRITGGDAAGLGGSAIGDWGAGGGVYAITGTILVSDSQVLSNVADVGGGLYLYNNVTELSGNTIYSNTANRSDGGLSIVSSHATLSNNRLFSNTAGLTVGGLGAYYSRALLNNNTVSSNANDGLVMYNSSGSVLSGNTVVSNTGNGLSVLFGGVTISNNVVVSNGIDGISLHQSYSTLNDNTVSFNNGRGLDLVSSNAKLSGNIVSSNRGGGFHLLESDAVFTANIVTSNAADIGGGLYLDASDATLVNNFITTNRAVTEAGGLYIQNSAPRLIHTTLARNAGGDWSGIVVTGRWGELSSVILTNTILVSHTVGVTVTAGSTARLEGSLWGTGVWGNGTDWGGDGTIVTGTVNVWGDPAFVNPDAGDYHISASSAAVDTGVDAGVNDDIDGDPRPTGEGYDIGADEYWPPGVAKHVYLPLVVHDHQPEP